MVLSYAAAPIPLQIKLPLRIRHGDVHMVFGKITCHSHQKFSEVFIEFALQ